MVFPFSFLSTLLFHSLRLGDLALCTQYCISTKPSPKSSFSSANAEQGITVGSSLPSQERARPPALQHETW